MFHDQTRDRVVRRPRMTRAKKVRYCAVLVDFENLYNILAQESPDTQTDDRSGDLQILDDAVESLAELRIRLREKYNGHMTIGRSYADFDRIGADAQSQLQLLAFEPRFMLGAEHKSSADIVLSIDAVEMLHTLPELDMFVIVGGDRDYLPVVRRLREHMKRVVLVGFEKSTNSDLRQQVGEENFIAAESLLPDGPPAEQASKGQIDAHPSGTETMDDPGFAEQESSDVPSDEETLELCMEQLLAAYYQYGGRTVWLTPFLRMLNDRFPFLDNRGRKRMVEDLQSRNAIRIDKVEGDPYPYSVVEINWEDNWVQGLDGERGNS